jgi:hypothetical protein
MPVTNSSLLSLLLHPSSLGKGGNSISYPYKHKHCHFNMGLADAGGAEAKG